MIQPVLGRYTRKLSDEMKKTSTAVFVRLLTVRTLVWCSFESGKVAKYKVIRSLVNFAKQCDRI